MGVLSGGGAAALVGALGGADVPLPVGFGDILLGTGHRFVGDAQAVGTHVGDQTHGAPPGDVHAFVQGLGGAHGAGGGEAQAAAGLLLQGGGDERRCGHLFAVAALQFGHGVIRALQVLHDAHGLGLVGDLQLFARGGAVEAGSELFLAGRRRQGGVQVPVFLGLEVLDLLFPVHDQAHGHALHPSGGQAPAHLAPQKRAELVAHQTVQNAAGLLGVEQVDVDGPGMGHALGDTLLGDLTEGDPVGVLDVQTQEMGQMPADGLALTVRVSGKEDLVGLFGLALQFLDELFLALDVDILRGVVVVHIDAQLAGGQIADVAHAGGDFVAIAQIFPNGLRLGRRLHDN